MSEEKKYFVFYHRIPNSTIVLADGAIAAFLGGKFVTADPAVAAQLAAEVDRGSQYLYIDPLKFEVTEKELDPMAEMKARIIAEYEAEKAVTSQADMGTSEQGKLKTVTTQTVGGVAGDSVSGQQGIALTLKPAASSVASE